MRKLLPLLAALTVLVPAAASSGEVPTNSVNGSAGVNAIVSAGGADTSNESTGTPFFIPLGAQLTVWCNAAAYIITDSRVAATATGNGLPVAAFEKFPTSVGKTITSRTSGAAKGGAIVRIFGTGAVTCYVFIRSGTE